MAAVKESNSGNVTPLERRVRNRHANIILDIRPIIDTFVLIERTILNAIVNPQRGHRR
jgi:hypothetical protein